MDAEVWIVMRARDDVLLIGETLDGLSAQDLSHRLLVLDNESTDGTAELARARADRFETIPRGAYVPGRVLNLGMRATGGPVVVFLNSDCTPVEPTWLRQLVAPFADPAVCATFGRQDPRPGCPPLEAKDIAETYGDGRRQARWRHCFSMASSAIRRSVWESLRFDETLGYSEDVDWSWRARQRGGVIRYVPESRVLHSHGYTLRQAYARQQGEGRAEAKIFEWSGWSASPVRYALLPYARQVLSDWGLCVKNRDFGEALRSPVFRFAQLAGRLSGFRDGRRAAVRGDR